MEQSTARTVPEAGPRLVHSSESAQDTGPCSVREGAGAGEEVGEVGGQGGSHGRERGAYSWAMRATELGQEGGMAWFLL